SFNVPNNTVVPVLSTSVTDITCSNTNSGSVSAKVGGTVTGYTFEWYNGNSIKPAADFTGDTYTNLSQGSYTVVVTDNVSQCTASTSVTVAQTGGVTVTATKVSDLTSCVATSPNGAASATVGGGVTGYSFAWFKGQNTLPANQFSVTSSVTGLVAGVYTVKATDAVTGCSDTDEVTILDNIVTPVLAATIVDVTHCSPLDGSITANVSFGIPSDYTFSWYNGPSVKATPDYPDTDNLLNGLTFGVYTVKAKHNTRNCDAVPITVTVLDKSPTIDIKLVGTITVLPSDCAKSDGVMGVTISAPGNTLGFTVQWFYGRAPFSAPSIKTETVPSNSVASGLKSGAYTVVALDKNSGCSSSQTFDLPFANSHSVKLVSKQEITTCVP
ncbi:MAG TPA: hypothetical protein VJ508_01870, partial [Saprospiraceae bacterium]|nr:hypothetical protein [Saprospiraceae bacterium]